MFPEVFPRKYDPSDPEFIVYQTLKKLPGNYVVFYSRRMSGGLFGKAECEIDFVVTNQKDALFCIEVKGGVIGYDGRNDRWMQNGALLEKNPDRQATEATHALLRALDRELRYVNVDWVLCFPQCSLADGSDALAVPRRKIIDERKLLHIDKEIRKLEDDVRGTFKKRGMTATEARHLIHSLTRGIGFVQVLGVRIAREAEQLIQVTQEQCQVLADVELNPRMIVQGSAGTGKTVLAQEFAKRLEAKGQSVLLLFYNRGIAGKVRYAFEKRGKVQVATFASFAKRLIEEVDTLWWQNQLRRDNEFWTLELPNRLLDIPLPSLPKFDAVIVDEGQDFKPEWFEFLQRLVREGAETFFTVFLDQHQDIFHHWKHFPCSPAPAKKMLTKNCRNTRAIVSYLNVAYPTGMTSFEHSPEGIPIVEREVTNSVDEQTQLVRDIKHLVGSEQIAPGGIVILLNVPKSESCLADTKTIASSPLESTYAGYDPNAKKIYYSTIDIFKGLEADVVFVVLSDRLAEDQIAKAIYVQGSRAKHALYIYRRKNAAGPASPRTISL